MPMKQIFVVMVLFGIAAAVATGSLTQGTLMPPVSEVHRQIDAVVQTNWSQAKSMMPAPPRTNYTVLPALVMPKGYETNLWCYEVSSDLVNWVPLLKNCGGKQSGTNDFVLPKGMTRAFFRMRKQKGWEFQ
jgi:hypothetical protein